MFGCFFCVVWDFVRSLKKEIIFEFVGEEIDLDKNLVEVLVDLFVYLVRNFVDYGIEMFDDCVVVGKLCMGMV